MCTWLSFRKSFACFDCHPNRMLHIYNKIIYLHILLWNLLARQYFTIYSVIKHKLFSSPNHIQVIIQRCTIKKMNQPNSQKNNFANFNCCNHKNACNLTRVEVWTTNNEQKLVCKRTKISTTSASSTSLLYSIFSRAKRLHKNFVTSFIDMQICRTSLVVQSSIQNLARRWDILGGNFGFWEEIPLTSEEFMPHLIILFSDKSSCYKNKKKFWTLVFIKLLLIRN